MSLPTGQPTVLNDIAPFNPPGTHSLGSLPALFFPPGSAPLLPSYPIRPSDSAYQQSVPPYVSPQMVVEATLLQDQAYQRLYQAESFILACPNSLPLHAEICSEKFELFSALEEEEEEQEVKAALRAVKARYNAELESSRQNPGPRFRSTTTVIGLLFVAAAEQTNAVAQSRLISLAQQYKDKQVDSVGDSNAFQVVDVVERERVIQKALQYESLMEKHPDSISLITTCIQKQFSILNDIEGQWQDEAASPLVRTIAEMYKDVSLQSLNTRVTPISTMFQVLANVEEQQSDPIVRVRVALMAKMYRSIQETSLDFASAFKQPPWDKADGIKAFPLAPASPSTAVPPPAITSQPRHSAVPALNLGGTYPQSGGLQSPMHPLSPSWSTGTSTVFNSASSQYGVPYNLSSPSLSSVHNTMRGQPLAQLQPQPSMNTLHSSSAPLLSKDDPVPPYPGEPVPQLARQPKVSFGENGTIKSKDQMLNTDGDALYRFLLDHLNAPSFRLHCYGSHTVTDVVADGKEVKTKERTIVDFDFVIDLSLSMQRGPGTFYVLDDPTWAYRGKMYKEMGNPNQPQSVHAWARDYAASPKTGKEFTFRKNVVGLDRTKTVDAIKQIISSTGHSTYRNVYFSVTKSTIQVRVDSPLMTMLKNSFISCLLWLVLVWPIIWLVRRYGKNGGKWDTCRASYICDRDPRDPDGTDGVPLGDGDWVKIWERTLRLAVSNRIKSSSPIYRPTANDSGVILFD